MARREDEEALLDGIIDEENRDYADEFRRALEHRRLVLIHFDRLLAKRGSELGARRRGEQPTERCCPGCGRAFRPMTDRQFETALKSHRKHALKRVAA
jgi:hypothetical protein